MNIYSHWWYRFIISGWNWFDVLVVAISVITLAMPGEGTGGVSNLRLLRAFRVFRLFNRVKSLRKIIEGIEASIPGVINSLVILTIFQVT